MINGGRKKKHELMRTARTCKRIYGGSPSLPRGSQGWRRNIRYGYRGSRGSIRLAFVPLLLFITIVVEYIQRLSVLVTRRLRLFPERLVVFLALEHLCRYLCWSADVRRLVVSVPEFVAVAEVWAGGCGCG